MEKEKIRVKIRQQRQKMSEDQVKKKSLKITEKIISLRQVKQAKTIMFYYPYGKEVCTKNMIKWALANGKKVCLPVLNKQNKIIPYQIKNVHGLLKKHIKYGILEPDIKICKKENKKKIDVVIVPGLAFDQAKNRLGQGKGCYDYFLKNMKAYKIGICFFHQLVKQLPTSGHDIPVDRVVTEQ